MLNDVASGADPLHLLSWKETKTLDREVIAPRSYRRFGGTVWSGIAAMGISASSR
jgi:hypothetical protein